MTLDANSSLYRRGVGVMLLNADRKVWVGARIDNPADAWQMPQGGIDAGEEPWATALRELEEETGIAPRLVERVAQCPERLRYSLPPELVGVIWKEPWLGQEQDWFLCRFLGERQRREHCDRAPGIPRMEVDRARAAAGRHRAVQARALCAAAAGVRPTPLTRTRNSGSARRRDRWYPARGERSRAG